MRISWIALFLVFLISASRAEVKSLDSLKEFGLGFRWSKAQKKLEIPFELHANLIVIPIKINNSDTLRFLVDTGLGTTLLTDSTVFTSLGLKAIRNIELKGLGEGEAIQAQVVIGVQLGIGDARALHQNLIYVDGGQLNLSDFVGTNIQGILGYDLFSNLVVTLDYARQKMILRQDENYRYRKSMGLRFPIEVKDNKPYIHDVCIVSKQGIKSNRLLLDSGAGHVLFLEGAGVDRSLFTFSDKQFYLGKGLNGAIIGNMGHVPQVRLGKWTWSHVPTAFPVPKLLKDSSQIQGSLGGEFLRRYVVTFNYLQQYVVFKPIGRQWKRPFEMELSGLGLRATGEKFRNFIIESVQANSPADEAGVLPGDEIWLINGVRTSDYELGDIYRILKKKEGKQVDLLVKRGNAFHFISFKLRSLF
ncbi:MAG: hypothetical protein RI981_226 [Bacteroidota bacterium]|jgi:predicted aspartyl protease